MNVSNSKYVAKQLDDVGFDYATIEKIMKRMEAGEERIAEPFQRRVSGGVQTAVAMLSKVKDEDFYFFNAFRSTLAIHGPDNRIVFNEGIAFMNKSHNCNLDEMELLLRGGSFQKEQITKDAEVYTGWVTIDKSETDSNGYPIVKSFHPNYGFSEFDVLKALPFQETANQKEIEKILMDLRQGLPAKVTHVKNEKTETYFMYLDVRYKNALLFHTDMRRLNRDERMELLGDLPPAQNKAQGAKLEAEGQSFSKGGVPF